MMRKRRSSESSYKKPYSRTRWSPTSLRELSPTIVKTGIDRRTWEQPIFPNILASTITRSHALRILVMRLFEKISCPNIFLFRQVERPPGLCE
ncbi:UNVERIFIED_CONTAM: hypothetical protein NCL1_50882 [Trichonephila clavipes]